MEIQQAIGDDEVAASRDRRSTSGPSSRSRRPTASSPPRCAARTTRTTWSPLGVGHPRHVERLVELLLGEVAALDEPHLERPTSRMVFSSASAFLATLAAFS